MKAYANCLYTNNTWLEVESLYRNLVQHAQITHHLDTKYISMQFLNFKGSLVHMHSVTREVLHQHGFPYCQTQTVTVIPLASIKLESLTSNITLR